MSGGISNTKTKTIAALASALRSARGGGGVPGGWHLRLNTRLIVN